MTTTAPLTLYTAIGVFQGDPNWIVEVSVEHFPTREDAEAYAAAFRIELVDGKLFRDDGKGVEIFDDSWRDVLDSKVTVSRVKTTGTDPEPVQLPIAQWTTEPGLSGQFTPISWRIDQETI